MTKPDRIASPDDWRRSWTAWLAAVGECPEVLAFKLARPKLLTLNSPVVQELTQGRMVDMD